MRRDSQPRPLQQVPRMARMPTLVIVTQVFVPDPAAVGQQIADVAVEMLRRGWRVVVFTASRGYEDPSRRYPRHEVREGVEIRRLPWSSFGKGSILTRLLAQTLFIAQATFAACLVRNVASVLVSTSPPFAPVAGVAISLIRGAPLTWWVMDLNPDQIVAVGKVSSTNVLVRMLEWLNRVTLRRARDIIVLDTFMEARLRSKGPVKAAIHVVPPWAHEEPIAKATDGAVGDFRERLGLADTFVVMYAGNHTQSNPLDTIIQAAVRMQDDHRVRFVFVGGGNCKSKIDDLVKAGAPNIRSLPYQPLDDLGVVLKAADLHVVALGDGMVGIVHPCKVYGVIATGRPVLYVGPSPSHVSQLLSRGLQGWSVRHGDVAGVVDAIEAAIRRKSGGTTSSDAGHYQRHESLAGAAGTPARIGCIIDSVRLTTDC